MKNYETNKYRRYRLLMVSIFQIVFILVVGVLLIISFSYCEEWQIIGNPGERASAFVTIDSINRRMLMFGGDNMNLFYGSQHNDVWSLTLDSTNTVWKRLYPQGTPPSPRRAGSAIYDIANQRMIIFGGITDSGLTNEVWALNFQGTPTWMQLFPTGIAPSPRCLHSAIYDQQNQRMIIFGGENETNVFNEVWALNLNNLTWQQLQPQGTQPASRLQHTAIYNPNNNQMIIFGGFNSGTFYNDVWTLSLSPGTETWTQLFPSGPPPTRAGQIAGYDPRRNKMIIFSGWYYDAGFYFWEDVWTLDLSSLTWTQLQPTGEMPIGRRHAMGVFDYFNDRLIIYGGFLYWDYYLCDTRALKISSLVNLEPPRYIFIPDFQEQLLINSPTNLPVAINYHLKQTNRIKLKVFNVAGKCIKTIFDGIQTEGPHRIFWDGKDEYGKVVNKGIFYCHFEQNGKILKKKFIIVK